MDLDCEMRRGKLADEQDCDNEWEFSVEMCRTSVTVPAFFAFLAYLIHARATLTGHCSQSTARTTKRVKYQLLKT